MGNGKIPVILDTDIGGDIDDTWALVQLLNCPELEVRLISTGTGNTIYRAKIVARMLEVAGRADIPIAVGIKQNLNDFRKMPQAPWVADYDICRYPGQIHEDGVTALVDCIMSSPEPITLISIGPLTNVAAALGKAPEIAGKCRFVGMHGSIRRQHGGEDGAIAEYNVVTDVPAAQQAFAAAWINAAITPLDTCGRVRLTGAKYRAVRESADPLLRAVIENYRIWSSYGERAERESSILFDTVAVHLAFSREFLVMEEMNLSVRGDGFTVADPRGRPFSVATDWKDLSAYEDYLVERLQG